jgi:hypothetical protein
MAQTTPNSANPALEFSAENRILNDHIDQIMVAIEAILRLQSLGLPELTLIKALQAPPWQLLGPIDFADPSQLYPAHFLVFHCLFRLRDDLALQGEALAISPLLIRLGRQSTVSGTGLPDQEDPLRLFYLDLAQYHLSAANIQRLLDNFWSGRYGEPIHQTELDDASRQLGLSQLPEEFDTVHEAYRRKAMATHPDRGGSTGQIQAVNQAFALLRRYFRSA